MFSRATSLNGSTAGNLRISIIDVNDEEPIITGTFTANINEEAGEGTIIPECFTASDADNDDVLKYSLSGMYNISTAKSDM